MRYEQMNGIFLLFILAIVFAAFWEEIEHYL